MPFHYIFYVITGIDLAVALIASLTFKKYKNSTERYFLYFLWFTLVVELTGGIIADVLLIKNFWLYNFYTIVSFVFYYYWYSIVIKQRLLLVFIPILGVVAMWNFTLDYWNSYQIYTFIVGAFFTLICTIYHFWQLLNSDEVLEVKYKLSFWISTGLLLFNMGMIPIMLLSKQLSFSETQYNILIITLNIILYGCYSIGFLWTKAKYNRS